MAGNKSISAEFPFDSRFIKVEGSRIHYIEEGKGDPILFIHGNPTSSYLWRNIIPHVSPVGRCIAMDLIGMGKSDKPDIEYRFDDHAQYVDGFISAMGLEKVTLVIHDWGSALGIQYARRHEGNVKGLALMEAIIRPFPPLDPSTEMGRTFIAFRTPDIGWDMIVNQNVFVEKILPGMVVRGLTDKEMDVYRAPFLVPESRKPVWRWPNEIPIEGEPADVAVIVKANNVWVTGTSIPKLLFYGHPGAILNENVVKWCMENMRNLKTVDIGPGLHYIQEDNPHLIGKELAKWYVGINSA
ncbi:haloalkane dehalogenase [bacterium]|nr:haloalkane dehalogenase [bacterium]